MSSIWLFIVALAICSFAHAEDDYDYDGLVSEEPMQVIVYYDIDELFLQLKFSFSEKTTKIWCNLPQGFDIT